MSEDTDLRHKLVEAVLGTEWSNHCATCATGTRCHYLTHRAEEAVDAVLKTLQLAGRLYRGDPKAEKPPKPNVGVLVKANDNTVVLMMDHDVAADLADALEWFDNDPEGWYGVRTLIRSVLPAEVLG